MIRKAFLTILLIFGFSFAYQDLNAKQFYEMIQKEKDVIILDVRTPQEYQEGHISNAINIPVQILGQQLDKLKNFKDKKILVYCRSGHRSAIASQILDRAGFKNVYNLKGGLLEWKASGLPLVK
ncbi:Rhodanese domain protein [Sulfurihydrogenibium sp. YO3AOP1]|uniref:rhodanese-like domain-containing protein n=1 Tax=Sulfurihydrogenibium sp. (strain YO3AOP1) TaxID=436114 RepID=UPI00017236A0|nr:rhodanese-like domain-containing protein [Sulfurihydrogenibium sp. YO3AOP1]ACD65796.1 Rhodanese domain protein [Sulfurihydrogenibium sp. YO3AOP1]